MKKVNQAFVGVGVLVASCSVVHAQGEPVNAIKLGYADIHFHTRTDDLQGPAGNTPPDIRSDINNTRTLALVYEHQIIGPWSLVLQLGVPPKLGIDGAGSATPLGKVASARAWFPAVLVQYKYPEFFGVRPYVGAGVNYTFFTNEHMTDDYTDAFAGRSSSVRLKNTWGGLAKLGLEYAASENWVVDISYSQYWIKTEAKISTDTYGVGEIDRSIKVRADPGVVGFLIGYRF